MKRNHFAEYAAYSEKYPDVKIMISIGGWSACGYFSEMAYTKEGRASFISSCIDLMKQYPWIDGIDLDWEYPGGSNDGERLSEGEGDQGCPIWGTKEEDQKNYASLCQEMRETFDQEFGEGVKKLTACASCSTSWTLPNQDWPSAAPYLDLINIMTYDMAGVWDGVTGHSSSLTGVKGAISYFLSKDIKASKLNIGTPLYSTGFVMSDDIDPASVVGAKIEETSVDGDAYTEKELREFENGAISGYTIKKDGAKVVMDEEFDNGGVGWHYAYDSKNGAAYMYNDDEKSEYYKWFLSYESPLSLQDKLDIIDQYDLAGIIVWECSQDVNEHEMIKQMGDNLIQK